MRVNTCIAGIVSAVLSLTLHGCSTNGSGGSTTPPEDGGATSDAPDEGSSAPIVPAGCVTDVSAGDHTFPCRGIAFNLSVPPSCARGGCGLITQLHGDTGDGALMEAHMKLAALGKERGYIVVSPTGPPAPAGPGTTDPGSTWTTDDDATIVAIIENVAQVFRTDAKRNHLTGFSRGGYVAWRLLCSHADMFASVAPAAAGAAPLSTTECKDLEETSCAFEGASSPSRKIPILFLLGRKDAAIPTGCLPVMRDRVVKGWGLGAPTTVASDAGYTHMRYSAGGALLETFEHDYETSPDGPWKSAKGHCYPGSTLDPKAPRYAFACAGPNAFTWGVEVMNFFVAHPAP